MKLELQLDFFGPKFWGFVKRNLGFLIWWCVYGIGFALAEKVVFPSSDAPTIFGVWGKDMATAFDAKIPILEGFIIPYLFWFVFLIGMLVFSILFDEHCFRKMMWFICITYTISLIIFYVYPTWCSGRPEGYAESYQNYVDHCGRDNFLLWIVYKFQNFDTNTNVFPSVHVLGSYAVSCAVLDCKYVKSFWTKFLFFLIATLIAVSTVFVKQHVVVDVYGGWAISLFGFVVVYVLNWKKIREKLAGHERLPQLVAEEERLAEVAFTKQLEETLSEKYSMETKAENQKAETERRENERRTEEILAIERMEKTRETSKTK